MAFMLEVNEAIVVFSADFYDMERGVDCALAKNLLDATVVLATERRSLQPYLMFRFMTSATDGHWKERATLVNYFTAMNFTVRFGSVIMT